MRTCVEQQGTHFFWAFFAHFCWLSFVLETGKLVLSLVFSSFSYHNLYFPQQEGRKKERKEDRKKRKKGRKKERTEARKK